MMYIRSFVFIACLAPVSMAQYGSIVDSKHNLSASGPGSIRATAEQEVCIFCHTPHQARAVQPLWNRNVPVNSYRVYSSTTLDAKPGQPTGTSKLCLSCHDGTVAVGSVLSRNMTIGMAGGATVIPPGAKGHIGTDLSDDHPISFPYDTQLAAKDGRLKDPGTLPTNLRLDASKNMQCSTCHDAHDNSNGHFLVMKNEQSQLCNSCHTIQTTNIATHTTCISCHQNHSAPSGPELLAAKTPSETCTSCHNSSNTKAADIASDLVKVSVHDTKAPVNAADAIPNQSSCNSCHDPHTMTTAASVVSAPTIRGTLGKVPGVNAAGTDIPVSQNEYEVCFKCHADRQPKDLIPKVTRKIAQANTRLEFDPSAISFHPIEIAGRNKDVPSLRNVNYTTSSLIYCTDCHSSDSGKAAGGTGPSGPHGSQYKPLLALRYDTIDRTSESEAAYALCYKCHDRNSILNDESFKYHKKHVVDQQTPCSVCHDPHGIPSAQGNLANNTHLINFDTKIVTPDPQGRLQFNDTGRYSGNCNLVCHNKLHNAEMRYPEDAGALQRAILRPKAAPKPVGGKK